MPKPSVEELSEKYKKLADEGSPFGDCFSVLKVDSCHFRPHPFMIGPKHVEYASDHCGGILGEDVCEKIPCYDKSDGRRCNLPMSEHTHDTVLFVQLKKNLANAEAREALLSVKESMEADGIDGVCFVETPERFRTAPATEEEKTGQAGQETEHG